MEKHIGDSLCAFPSHLPVVRQHGEREFRTGVRRANVIKKCVWLSPHTLFNHLFAPTSPVVFSPKKICRKRVYALERNDKIIRKTKIHPLQKGKDISKNTHCFTPQSLVPFNNCNNALPHSWDFSNISNGTVHAGR